MSIRILGGADSSKLKWNTCIPLEYGGKMEYKYVNSTRIPVNSMYSGGIRGRRALWNTKWNTYSPPRVAYARWGKIYYLCVNK